MNGSSDALAGTYGSTRVGGTEKGPRPESSADVVTRSFEAALRSLSSNTEIGSSQAYERMRSYIDELRVPAARLRAAAQSLLSARLCEGGLSYDLSGIDLSWRSDASSLEYWRERNRLIPCERIERCCAGPSRAGHFRLALVYRGRRHGV